jgi:hypothetical protein
MELPLLELKQRILEKYGDDPETLCDLLRISGEDIINMFQHRILVHRENFSSEEYYEEDSEVD